MCIILYNLLIGWTSSYEVNNDNVDHLSDIDTNNELNEAMPTAAGGDKRRDQLFHWMMKQHIQPQKRQPKT